MATFVVHVEGDASEDFEFDLPDKQAECFLQLAENRGMTPTELFEQVVRDFLDSEKPTES